MKTMTKGIRRSLVFVVAGGSLQAIEPPVESQPIPPKVAPANEAPKARIIPDDELPKAVPIPEEHPEMARPYIGVILDPVPQILSSHLQLPAGEGLVIGELVVGGPAEAAGLKENDILTKVAGRAIGNTDEVRRIVEEHAVGDEVSVEVIQNGRRQEVAITLGAAPRAIPAPGFDMAQGQPFDQMMGQLPEKHAELLRQAMEQRMQGLGMNDGGMPDNWQRDLLKRMERGMRGFDEEDAVGGFRAESTMRLLDGEGSIELKTTDGSREVRVFDKEGTLLWEGPYDTPQDKAAVPDDIGERIEKLDFDIESNGFKLRLGPKRFRPLDEVAPDQ